jgi:trimeric autotransporter adhesin
MANSRKRISELPALSVASLDTTFVLGISGSTTYKISINNLTSSLDTTFATDLVTATLSSSLDGKLSTSSFNSYTSSFTASVASGTISGSSQLTSSFDTRYVVSGSITQTTWDNIANKPSGIVSQSTDLSSLNTFTASISTASLVNRLNAIENVSGSWITESETGSFLTSLSGAISGAGQIADLGFVTGSYTTINSFNSLTQSFNSISQSFNVISGSVGTVDFSTLATTGSNTFIGNQTISGGLSINNGGYSWSFESNGRTKIPNITFNSDRGTGMVGIKPAPGREFQIETSTAESSVGPWSFGLDGTLSAPVGANILRVGNLVTTSSFNSYTASISTASLVTSISNLNSATSSYLTSLSGAISSSSQLTSSFDTRYVASGSIGAVPAGTISGSAQLTSSYDSRYSLSGSVLTSFSSSVDTRLDTLEETIISGSVNYVQTLGARVTGVTSTGVTIITGSITTTGNPIQIMVTGDANPVNVTSWTRLQIYRNETAIGNIVQVENSSNLNVPYCLNVIDTPSAGTYTYSMRTVSGISGLFDFGESTGPTLTAVELKTNTNLPSTNNSFTGTNTFRSTTTFAAAGGDEGGEIQFGVPLTNTTLQNRVTVDVWQNRLRFFEGSANANGVYIDLSKPITGNNNEITYKASGIVNAGTFVTLDNIKATVTTSGQRGLSLATVSETFACNIGGNFAGAAVGASGTAGSATITTSASTSIFGWGFTAVGDMANYIITDTTNSRAYRIIIQIGASFNNNLVSIERLH